MIKIIGKYIKFNYPDSVIHLLILIGFTLMITVFNYKYLKKKLKRFDPYIIYFKSFFFFLFVLPFLFILLFVNQPLVYLKNIGFSFGDFNKGLIFIIFGIPILYLVSLFSVKEAEIQKQYPFSKEACRSLKKFILYEISYCLFYYFTWEFVFRGLILFTLLEKNGFLIAVFIQTVLSTVYHIGHPRSEIYGALFGGIIFGAVAFFTNSFFYSFIFHAFLGICNDTILYLRFYRKKIAK